MDLDDLIPEDFKKKLRCFICKNYLSYFPIFLCSNSRSFCGRCTILKKISFSKNKAFEAIAHNLTFPCRYSVNGCSENLTPKDIPQHEGNCPFENKLCPLACSDNCTWKGPLHKFMSHCNQAHDDTFLNNGEFKVNFLLSKENVNLLKFDEKLFIIETKFDCRDKVLECAVYSYEDDIDRNKYPCHLSVQSGNNTASVDFSLSSLSEKSFGEVCLAVNPRKQDVSGNVELTGKIVLCKQNNQAALKTKTHLEILSPLRCLECFNVCVNECYMPHCSQHILCKRCLKTHYRECMKCKGKFLPKSIEVSDKIVAVVLILPCKFYKDGCKYALQHNESYADHVIECPYRDCECIFGCDWFGCAKDLTEHTYDCSLAALINLNVFITTTARMSTDLNTKYSEYVENRGKLFRVDFGLDKDENYFWKISPLEKLDSGFKYKLELYGDNGNKVAITQEIKVDGSTSYVFDESQLKDFNFSEFKVQIFK